MESAGKPLAIIRASGLKPRLALLLLAAIGALVSFSSDYDSIFPALGGPNGLFYDLTLKISQPWRRDIPTVPAAFVAIDDATLSRPEFAALPRALFQPIWARLIDGLLMSGARRIAFDVVLAYAGADFRVETFALPDYDQRLIESLQRGRDRIVLGRFPTQPVAPTFAKAVGTSRIGVLDLQVESDGRIRSTGAFVRLPDGRIVFGFAALAAGLSISQASSAQRLLIAPSAQLAETPAYSLGILLDCLASKEGLDHIREAIEGRIVVVGTAVLGEDEHRGPTRFLGQAKHKSSGDRCAPQYGLVDRREPDSASGALLQLAAIQSAARARPVTLAGGWLRAIAGAGLALLFGIIALQDETPLTIGERDVSPPPVMLMQLVRSTISGLAGPCLCGCFASAACFIYADLWLPLGYPVLATSLAFATILGLRWGRHRALFNRLYRTAGRYLPPARLATLARGGFVETPEGQERDVSILLVDLVGFTPYSNEADRMASEVIGIANHYFTLMQAAIDRHAGCSDKFLGDAVLAFWNGLSDEPNHALKALVTAHEIISAVGNAEGPGHTRMVARAVVCSGRVYVGDLGAKQRSNFTIIGPAVNETFRLEKLPDFYGLPLLVSASAADLIMMSMSAAGMLPALTGNVLVRIDDVDLKGFAMRKSVYALVPADDPGLAKFEAGRRALDRNLLDEGFAHLKTVQSGMLQRASSVLSARYDPCQLNQTPRRPRR